MFVSVLCPRLLFGGVVTVGDSATGRNLVEYKVPRYAELVIASCSCCLSLNPLMKSPSATAFAFALLSNQRLPIKAEAREWSTFQDPWRWEV